MLFKCGLVANSICNITTYWPEGHHNGASTYPSYEYGNWKISNCPPHETQMIIASYDLIRDKMPLVINEASLGQQSQLFRIFFSQVQESDAIEAVYNQISNGDPINCLEYSNGPGSTQRIMKQVQKQPEFVCAQPGPDWTRPYYDRCNKVGSAGTSFAGLPYVLLCDNFWSLGYPGDAPTKVPTCPAQSNVLPQNSNLVQAKVATILHELWHLYTRNQRTPEIYSLKDCAALTGTDALSNANNFAFFAMSVWQKCTAWPSNLKRSLRLRDYINHSTDSTTTFNSTNATGVSPTYSGRPSRVLNSIARAGDVGITKLSPSDIAALEPAVNMYPSFDIPDMDPWLLELNLNFTSP